MGDPRDLGWSESPMAEVGRLSLLMESFAQAGLSSGIPSGSAYIESESHARYATAGWT